MKLLKKKNKGLLLCLIISIPVWILVKSFHSLEVIGAPIIAILTGLILGGILKDKSAFQDGISFCSKKILQYAVILLGFGLNLNTVRKVGMASLPIILSTITTSLAVSFILHKVMNVPSKISTLIGVGSSICGGSAIAATAPIINADDEEIAGSISVIFLFNVIAAIIFPTLGSLLGLSNNGFGLFAGTAINDMSSVTAAASTWDTTHGTNGAVLGYATIVKLTRTLAIIPITLILSIFQFKKSRKNNEEPEAVSIKNTFPMFILYFIFASIVTTFITSLCSVNSKSIATTSFFYINQLSKFFIVMAMSAIGLNTNLAKLVKSGIKPIIMGLCCWIAISSVSLFLQNALHIF